MLLVVLGILVFASYIVMAKQDDSQDTTIKRVTVNQIPSIKTQHDLSQINNNGISLKKPSVEPAISEAKAIDLASQYADVYANTAKSIVAEYHLMTNDQFYLFSESAKEKNPKLKKDGILCDTPVYIVSFKGINRVGHNSFGGKEPTVFQEFNLVVDANSGEILYGFSYR